jgi:hypothetical protein
MPPSGLLSRASQRRDWRSGSSVAANDCAIETISSRAGMRRIAKERNDPPLPRRRDLGFRLRSAWSPTLGYSAADLDAGALLGPKRFWLIGFLDFGYLTTRSRRGGRHRSIAGLRASHERKRGRAALRWPPTPYRRKGAGQLRSQRPTPRCQPVMKAPFMCRLEADTWSTTATTHVPAPGPDATCASISAYPSELLAIEITPSPTGSVPE